MTRAWTTTLALGLSLARVPGSAQADVIDDFITLVESMGQLAQTNQGNCTDQTAALEGFLADNNAQIKTVARTLMDSSAQGTDAQNNRMEVAYALFEQKTEGCPEANLTIVSLLDSGSEQQELQAGAGDMVFAEDVAPPAKKTKPVVPAKPEPPSAEAVKSMCAEWEESAKKYGSDCSAYGKRLQRQFNALPYKLSDVPRFGDHRKALIGCKNAVKATAACADHAEVIAAHALAGEL